jgi:hypothetical protein
MASYLADRQLPLRWRLPYSCPGSQPLKGQGSDGVVSRPEDTTPSDSVSSVPVDHHLARLVRSFLNLAQEPLRTLPWWRNSLGPWSICSVFYPQLANHQGRSNIRLILGRQSEQDSYLEVVFRGNWKKFVELFHSILGSSVLRVRSTGYLHSCQLDNLDENETHAVQVHTYQFRRKES